MSNPEKQHYISKTYLKHFTEANEGRFVYVFNFGDPYKRRVQKLGINSAVFKKKNYYSSKKFVEPFALEKLFSSYESRYNLIIKEISKEEKNLSQEIRAELILWLFVTQMRNPVNRENTERIYYNLLKTTSILRKDGEC